MQRSITFAPSTVFLMSCTITLWTISAASYETLIKPGPWISFKMDHAPTHLVFREIGFKGRSGFRLFFSGRCCSGFICVRHGDGVLLYKMAVESNVFLLCREPKRVNQGRRCTHQLTNHKTCIVLKQTFTKQIHEYVGIKNNPEYEQWRKNIFQREREISRHSVIDKEMASCHDVTSRFMPHVIRSITTGTDLILEP